MYFQRLLLCTVLSGSLLPSLADAAPPVPPVAEKKPFAVLSPNGNRPDDYYWLRDDDRKDPQVLAYLNAENAYTDALLVHTKPLQEKLYGEIVSRIKQDDSSVPYRKNGWWYYSRWEAGQSYPIYARKQGDLSGPEQVMLDVPKLAAGHEFYSIGAQAVSPNSKLLAYTEDAVGRRQYSLRFKNLETGQTLPDRIENVQPKIAWAADNRTVIYVERDPVTLLGRRVRKHLLGADPASDPIVYEEPDTSFYLDVDKTKDDRYLYIHAQSTVSSEMRVADAHDPDLAFRIFLPRERDHEYQAEHLGNRWIIRTNWQAKNFRIMEVNAGDEADRGKWRELVPHRGDAFINGMDVFAGFLAIDERTGGLRKIRIRNWSDGAERFIASDDPTYAFSLGDNYEIDATTVRYSYDSLTTPTSIFDFDVQTGERKLLKRDPVLGDFSPSNYDSEYLWATGRDGVKIPVSLVYRKGLKRDGKAPLFQYAYGSYGNSTDPDFSVPLLSLLDRGFVYAIAHVRGGQEMGRDWYDNGRLLKKQNTFNDFVDVTRFLVKERYASPDRVVAYGGSAGGLLMGAVANQAPKDYKAIIAAVPFVDVVTTMLDESIPLTTNEFDEWGNPKQKQFYDYMLAYSPYDQVAKQAYPSMYVYTALWDSQVQYYEPAKWVAKLRASKTDANPLVFRTTMAAGHGGKSGRFERYRQAAEQYAFALDQVGIRN
jgi:oligopeptidase B